MMLAIWSGSLLHSTVWPPCAAHLLYSAQPLLVGRLV